MDNAITNWSQLVSATILIAFAEKWSQWIFQKSVEVFTQLTLEIEFLMEQHWNY